MGTRCVGLWNKLLLGRSGFAWIEFGRREVRLDGIVHGFIHIVMHIQGEV